MYLISLKISSPIRYYSDKDPKIQTAALMYSPRGGYIFNKLQIGFKVI